MSLVKKAIKTLTEECGYKVGQSILVACSGGPDSVALLCFLTSQREKLGIPELGVYHLNHCFRGKEADADEAFVRGLAEELSLRLYSEKIDISAYAAEHGISLEMAGRKLRYAGLERIMAQEGFDLAALGHTASDNAEWLLVSLIRGRAEPLLWGIPARRTRFIRPLIRSTREEVYRFLKDNQFTYREDSSNVSFEFTRNRIRHLIMPLLVKENPSFEKACSRILSLGDGVKAFLDSQTERLYERLVKTKGPARKLDTSKLSRYNPATQLHILRRFAPWLGAEESVKIIPFKGWKGTRELAFGCGEVLYGVYDRLVVEPAADRPSWDPQVLREDREITVPRLGWRLRVHRGDLNEVALQDKDRVFFDARYQRPPFEVRPWQEGDRIVPFGRHGSVKIKRIFTDRKVPRRIRRHWPLVSKGNKVLWVAGLVRSSLSPVTDNTRKVTIITLLREENGS
ncbi:tRNA lysidine(34) synthetase TilS [candidate division WOR-3 bacterium]|nr:tRNA lysidine(34) synthetase TilS [candidate division WOR-3 bacterium]